MAVIRNATPDDVDSICRLIAYYAEKGIMLPRSRELVKKLIDTFIVAVDGDRVVGIGSLYQLGKELVEIRSLGILDEYRGRGIGSALVNRLVEEAQKKNFRQVMALTYEVKFFEKNGFSVVQKEIFPEKVWTDCIHCKKRHHCDEIAVLRRLD